jgi:hypothetical protein
MKAGSQDSDCIQEKLLRLKAWTDPSKKGTPFHEAIDKMISEYPSMYGKCSNVQSRSLYSPNSRTYHDINVPSPLQS